MGMFFVFSAFSSPLHHRTWINGPIWAHFFVFGAFPLVGYAPPRPLNMKTRPPGCVFIFGASPTLCIPLNMSNMPIWACFMCSASLHPSTHAPAPPHPPSPLKHIKHARLGVFDVLGTSSTHPLTPQRHPTCRTPQQAQMGLLLCSVPLPPYVPPWTHRTRLSEHVRCVRHLFHPASHAPAPPHLPLPPYVPPKIGGSWKRKGFPLQSPPL